MPKFVYLNKDLFELQSIIANKNFKGRILFSPLSGTEPSFDPVKWNKPTIKQNHNCYSYAFNQINPTRKGKAQPGYYSGFNHIEDNEYNCQSFYQRLKKDNPSLYLTSFEQPCVKGFNKGFIAIDDKKDDQDYHFYRLDKNKKWSHKPGRTEVTKIDASGSEIDNPLTANRDYQYFAYKKPCFFFCAHPKLGRQHSVSIRGGGRKISPEPSFNVIHLQGGAGKNRPEPPFNIVKE
jgi:hypothetical protein